MTFEEFAASELAPLVRFATVLTDDRGLAEDVCQEVLVRARSQWSRIGTLDHPRAYVRKMIVNEYLSWRRKWTRILPRDEIVVADTHPDHAERITQRDELRTMLAALPTQQRTALVLRYFEDLPDRDIAAIMSCREATVRAYIHRALQTLRIDVVTAAPSLLRKA